MKQSLVAAVAAIATITPSAYALNSLRANNVGYLCDDVKVAIYLGDKPANELKFSLIDAAGNSIDVDSVRQMQTWERFSHSARIYFSSLATPGEYTLVAKGKDKDEIKIYVGNDAYSRLNLHEAPLNYLRQQRCGYNPVYADSCHTNDGILVDAGDLTGTHVDVTGGWHDASDYLQYLTTSANTVYQLLFAYKQNPHVWADNFSADGAPGANGIPDILDEARWGLQWMLKMNPKPNLFLNQIADDRDHRYVGLPANDSTDYEFGKGVTRPVYPCSPRTQGLKNHFNRSTGLASSVAKFASSFALGSEIFAQIDPQFADTLVARSLNAYAVAKASPGACQTAPCVSPYFYEEDNFADDLQLAAMSVAALKPSAELIDDAVNFGRLEPITPWMGADSARHYQWYPFVNLGQYLLATDKNAPKARRAEALRNIRSGISRVAERGNSNVWLNGIPFIWCSNNLTVAFVTQAMLYRNITADNTYKEYETAMRDWLFGANPWGQTMIILPSETQDLTSPAYPHSATIYHTVNGKPGRESLVGGIVDGPVYASIYNSLWGVHLNNPDPYAEIQNSTVVYHDDFADYSTNEPTMDGTASTTYMLSTLSNTK